MSKLSKCPISLLCVQDYPVVFLPHFQCIHSPIVAGVFNDLKLQKRTICCAVLCFFSVAVFAFCFKKGEKSTFFAFFLAHFKNYY